MLNIERYKEEISRNIIEHNIGIYGAAHGVMSDLNFKFSKEVYREQQVQVFEWLCSEYKEPILNDKEKEYLSNVIKPFRNNVIAICKERFDDYEYITIYFKEEDGEKEAMSFPIFKKGTMYKGMKTDKDYTLEELGLC